MVVQMAALGVVLAGHQAAPFLERVGIVLPPEAWRGMAEKKMALLLGIWFIGGRGRIGLSARCFAEGWGPCFCVDPPAAACSPPAPTRSPPPLGPPTTLPALPLSPTHPKGNTVRQNLLSTGAFEISYEGHPVWSKLSTGEMPRLADVVDGIAAAMRQGGAQAEG